MCTAGQLPINNLVMPLIDISASDAGRGLDVTTLDCCPALLHAVKRALGQQSATLHE